MLLQRLILVSLKPGTEEKIFERVPIENSMDDQPQVMALKINTVIAHPKPMQRATGAFQLAEVIHLRVHDLLR